MRKTRMLDAVLRLYPPWWRARYEEEVRAIASDVIAAGRPPWRVLGNLFTGAMRLRATGANTPRQFAHWAGRTRASIAVATLPVLAVIPVVIYVLQGRQGISPGRTTTSPFRAYTLSGAGHVANYASLAIALALLLAVSTLLWGYVGLARAVRRRAGQDRRLRRLAWMPGIAALLTVATWVPASFVRPHLYLESAGVSRALDGSAPLAHGLYVASAVCLGLGVSAGLLMVVLVARQARLSISDLASGQAVGFTTSALLWVMAGGAMTSVVALARQGGGNYAVLTSSWGSWRIAGALVVVAAAVVSTMGTVNASRALRVAAQLPH
jgi:hypothetical protein